MSNEVKAAAERLRANKYAKLKTGQQLEDLARLAQVYLREHPADDETPIDEAWLRSVATAHPLKYTLIREYGLPMGLWKIDGGWKLMILHSESAATCVVRDITTRGQLRSLCRCLGITLEETGS